MLLVTSIFGRNAEEAAGWKNLRNEQLVGMVKTIKYGAGLQRTLWKLKMNTASFWKL